jgi:hypothetical protein
LKRRKIERTQLPENFEAAHDDIPYLDVDVGMGIDFGGDDFFLLYTRLKRQWSHSGNDLDIGRMDEAIDMRHSSEVEFSTTPTPTIYTDVVRIGTWSSPSNFTPLFRPPWREQSRN